jgi:nicotinate-nucleotide adenylyltransferase
MAGVEMNRPLRTGLYGGSFDPVHHGHLILAREAMEELGLDRVVFIPANCSPHKPGSPPADAGARLEMLRVSLDGEPGFELDDCELRRGGPSYAIDTVRAMRARHPGDELFYFIGEDNVEGLETWREFEALHREVRFVVLARRVVPAGGEFPVVARRIEISSTEIRNRVAAGRSVRYLLPTKAWEIIRERRLYSDD